MKISLEALATLFKLTGAAVGIPSLTALLLYGANVLRHRLGAGSPAGNSFGENPDAILLLLKGITATIGGLARALGSFSQFLFDGIAMMSGAGLLFAALCWLTGRGLLHQAVWARWSGGVLVLLLLLPSLVLALSLRGSGRLLMLGSVFLCLLAFQALWSAGTTVAPKP